MNLFKSTTFLICYALTPLFSIGSPTPPNLLRSAQAQQRGNYYFLLAASQGDLREVVTWLDKGASVNCMDQGGRIALWFAAINGKSDLAELLISRGTDIDAIAHAESGGWSPLHAAVIAKSPAIVRMLIKAKANINALDSRGFTPFALAAQLGYVQIADILLSAGANHEIRNLRGEKALVLAIEENHGSIITLLRDKKGVNFDDPTCTGDKGHPVCLAADKGCAKALAALLSSGASADFYAKESPSPLTLAATWGYLECVKLLLARNVNVDLCIKGVTPLWAAARNGYAEIVEVLLQAGASPAHQNLEGVSVMQIAQKRGHKEVIYVLEKHISKLSPISRL